MARQISEGRRVPSGRNQSTGAAVLDRPATDAKQRLLEEVLRLTGASAAGRLNERGRTDQFEGTDRKLIEGINSMLDAINKPIQVVSECLRKLSRGETPHKIEEVYSGDFNPVRDNLNALLDGIQKFTADSGAVAQDVKAEKFEARLDASLSAGPYSAIVSNVNAMLETLAEKINWHLAVIDAVPFPVHVLDSNMNWTFLNRAFEKLMREQGYISDRAAAMGRPCSTANANICNTEKCGVQQLRKGIPESFFDWVGGSKCKQNTASLINTKGTHIGYVEVVQDLTSIVGVKEYTATEVNRLAANLTQLAQGSFTLDSKLGESSQHTVEVKEQFNKIDKSLDEVCVAMTRTSKNLSMLGTAAAQGDLTKRAEVGNLQGGFRSIVEGMNEMLDAILIPIGEGNRVLAQISAGQIDELITQNYSGDHEKMKQSVNTIAGVLQGLQKELQRLTDASRDGRLSERGKPNQFRGAYAGIVTSINDMLDAILLPIGEGNRVLALISDGKIDELIAQTYKGDHEKMKLAVNNVAVALQSMAKEVAHLTQGAIEGKLATRADASKHLGDYRKIVEGVNRTLDAVIGPLNVSADYVERISKGAIPPKITDQYNGDFNSIKNNLNNCIDNINALVVDAAMLAKAASEGKLATRADASKHQGDFHKIVEGVNRTLDAVVKPIRAASAVIGRIAAKDLKARVEGEHEGDFAALKEDINKMASDLQENMRDFNQNAQALASSAEEMSAVSHQMAGNAEETATQANVVSAASEQVSKNVSSVASASEEMQASIREIAKNANESARVAKNAVSVAHTTNETVKKLGESSQEIGNVIKVITSIAQQTNLLALNATIEAARAGEAGKGFAVVANEVKELAKQTAKATEEISQKIEAIQGDTKGAVKAIEEIGAIINQINDISNSIASAVEEQTVTTNEIGRSVTEAAKGVGDIAKNIGGVAMAAKNTTQGASDTQNAAQELSRMAARLQKVVSQFNI